MNIHTLNTIKTTNDPNNHNSSTTPGINKIETLKLDKWDKDVKNLLTKACQHVKQLISNRNWSVGLVQEFLPPNPNLQGLLELSTPTRKKYIFDMDTYLYVKFKVIF